MTKRNVRYPHTIGFRITDETWLRIEQEIAETDLTVHDWCRLVVMDRLTREVSLSKNERILFFQSCRTHYLVSNAFKLLAADNLTTDEWDKVRRFAIDNVNFIAEGTLERIRSGMENNEPLNPKRT